MTILFYYKYIILDIVKNKLLWKMNQIYFIIYLFTPYVSYACIKIVFFM